MSSSEYPRELAVKIIQRVLAHEGEPLDEVLEEAFAQVDPRAKPWLQEVCSGTVRWWGRAQLVIDSHCTGKKPTGWTRKVLALAVYQLIAQTRTSPAAVVDETVELIKKLEGEPPAKFANAILRKIAGNASEWAKIPHDPKLSISEQANWGSLPLWLWKKLYKSKGLAWTKAFAEATHERPKIWVRAKNSNWKMEGASAGPIENSWVVEPGDRGPVPSWPGFDEGDFIIQDISSQKLIYEVLSRFKSENLSLQNALDLCAAPGGKAVGLHWGYKNLVSEGGLNVTATDLDGPRMKLLEETVSRVAPQICVKPIREIKGEFDLVWVDAPCSGTGIIRRHPDVKWLKSEGDLAPLETTQLEVIRRGWSFVKRGGALVYSVCSILPDEGEKLIELTRIEGKVLGKWMLEPQTAPFGDGFWAVMIQKD